jgi:hypothetical protein
VAGCETGISCLARDDEYGSSDDSRRRDGSWAGGALTRTSQRIFAPASRAVDAALLDLAGGRGASHCWCRSLAGMGR